jgi:hypothetical protein
MSSAGTIADLLDSRRVSREISLTPFRYHAGQQAFFACEERFVALCGGRRAGKSDLARRRQARRAIRFHEECPGVLDGHFVITCPTRDQVKRLHWEPLKRLYPARLVASVSESELTVHLMNGVRHRLVGLDKFVRAEGEAIDDALIDEIADTKEDAWRLSIRPSLATPGRPSGRATFIGKPRGRNHWWRIWTEAAEKEGWAQFHWSAEEILEAQEIEDLKRDLDPLSYDQEVRANFVNFRGRAYYAFEREVQGSHQMAYDPSQALDMQLDFNNAPGVAVVSQEQHWQERTSFPVSHALGFPVTPYVVGPYDAILWETRIAQNSNTLRVCAKVIEAWRDRHRGRVRLFGDASGGNRTSSSVAGSDWDLVRRELRQVKHWQLEWHVPAANPPERDRVNATNARLMTTDGHVRMMVDPVECPWLIADLESVSVKKDGTGELDKSSDHSVTHLSDAVGYRVWKRHPTRSRRMKVEQV